MVSDFFLVFIRFSCRRTHLCTHLLLGIDNVEIAFQLLTPRRLVIERIHNLKVQSNQNNRAQTNTFENSQNFGISTKILRDCATQFQRRSSFHSCQWPLNRPNPRTKVINGSNKPRKPTPKLHMYLHPSILKCWALVSLPRSLPALTVNPRPAA